MYVPRHFVEADEGYITDFVRKHAFGTLVSWDGQRPVASQLLFNLIGNAGSEKVLFGHMARSNPQWKSFSETQEVLAIFQGPHAYISAAWHSMQSVPTWNYVTVQVYGHLKVIEDREELYRELKHLVDSQEEGSPEGERYRLESIPAALRDDMMNAIVGFHVRISRIDCAAKLSQNRSDGDQKRIISKLTERGDASSLAVAKEMQTRRIEGTT